MNKSLNILLLKIYAPIMLGLGFFSLVFPVFNLFEFTFFYALFLFISGSVGIFVLMLKSVIMGKYFNTIYLIINMVLLVLQVVPNRIGSYFNFTTGEVIIHVVLSMALLIVTTYRRFKLFTGA